jgi:hypothetical protein
LRIGVVLQVGTFGRKAVASVQRNAHRLPQVGELGTVLPSYLCLLLAGLAFTRLHQLAQNPAGLLLQRSVDLDQRRPARRPHRQTVRPHDKTDGAALGAGKSIGHQRTIEAHFAIGTGMGIAHGVNCLLQGLARDEGLAGPGVCYIFGSY